MNVLQAGKKKTLRSLFFIFLRFCFSSVFRSALLIVGGQSAKDQIDALERGVRPIVICLTGMLATSFFCSILEHHPFSTSFGEKFLVLLFNCFVLLGVSLGNCSDANRSDFSDNQLIDVQLCFHL